ncbi:ornithine carbamoyltransferase [Terramyces sp. JEL0728]|nr:ornithine carbamoyltransferase [Terramyces sp. JEL0728]
MKHLITLRDYSKPQILQLIRRSLELKAHVYKQSETRIPSLKGKTLGMIFTKRSTRTRVSAETGWAFYGGHPLFLGSQDIQLGGGEPLSVTAKVVSSMVDCILARVGQHSEIAELAQYSKVPVINALSAKYHPLQILADLMTLYEAYLPSALEHKPTADEPLPPLPKLNIAWVGDSNNIINSMLVTYPRLGLNVNVATPEGYPILPDVLDFSKQSGKVGIFNDPVQAVKDADVIVTDTWVSMGQEDEKAKRLNSFKGFQVTEELGKHAKPDWKFMHCLPRKPYEVDDQVFNGPRSLIYPEAENRKYTVMAVYEALMK